MDIILKRRAWCALSIQLFSRPGVLILQAILFNKVCCTVHRLYIGKLCVLAAASYH
jgi:hypothetical protein